MVRIRVASDFCHVRCGWMRRVLQCLPRVRTILQRLWPRLRLRPRICRLPRRRHGGGWRSAVLHSRCWLLRGPRLLRLEAWTLGTARRSKSLDSRPLRSEIIELRVAGSLVSPQPFRTGRWLSNGANQPPAGKAEPKGGGDTAKSVAYASAEIDR